MMMMGGIDALRVETLMKRRRSFSIPVMKRERKYVLTSRIRDQNNAGKTFINFEAFKNVNFEAFNCWTCLICFDLQPGNRMALYATSHGV